MQNVLITGAAGRIGGVLREGLMDNYLLRLTDRSRIENPEVVAIYTGLVGLLMVSKIPTFSLKE